MPDAAQARSRSWLPAGERAGLGARCRFVQGSVLALPYRGPFDIVMCLGVLAHVGDPRGAFAEVARVVRPGGLLYVSHINRLGFALRRFKRGVAGMLAGGDPRRKTEWAKRLWRRHIERAARFGHRTQDQIAWDNFVAPHLTASVAEWLAWMDENELEYMASFPSFYSLKVPNGQTGGIETMATFLPPASRWHRWALVLAVQLRWALALRVGGLASISFLARKHAR